MIEGLSFTDALWLTFQVIASAGFTNEHKNAGERTIMLFSGLVVFAILVGFITEVITEFMADLNAGETKVAESGHTLILGWNESTARVVCQMAFLRRAYRMQNETWERWCMPWLRVRPSTPAAVAPVVILTDK